MAKNLNQLIAVNDPFTLINLEQASVDLSILKREALMFNTAVIPTLKESFFESNYLYQHQRHILDELDWLLERKIIHEVPKWPAGTETMADDVHNFASAYIRSTLDKDEQQLEIINKVERTFRAMGELSAHVHVMMLRDEGYNEVYPVVAFGLRSKEQEPKSDVIDVVIDHLPTPEDNTPWEEIYEVRSDPETHRKFLALKQWINETAKLKLPPNEVNDKLKSLIADYEAHMRSHKIKTRLEAFKTILLAEVGISTAGWFAGFTALAGLAGAIAAPLFSLKMTQIGLTEEERKAPGKELAYVVKMQKTFNQN